VAGREAAEPVAEQLAAAAGAALAAELWAAGQSVEAGAEEEAA